MKKKSSKKNPKKLRKEANNELGQTKNSAKLILFIFGIGPIIGIIIFLFTKSEVMSPDGYKSSFNANLQEDFIKFLLN